jgi:hypothetical protein
LVGRPVLTLRRHGKDWADLTVTGIEISLQPVRWKGPRFQLTYRDHKRTKWTGRLPGTIDRTTARVSDEEVTQLINNLQTADGIPGRTLDDLCPREEDKHLWVQAVADHWPCEPPTVGGSAGANTSAAGTSTSAQPLLDAQKQRAQECTSPQPQRRPRDEELSFSPFERALRQRFPTIVLKNKQRVAFHFSSTKVTIANAGTLNSPEEPDFKKKQSGDGQVPYRRGATMNFGLPSEADLSDVACEFRRRFCACAAELDEERVNAAAIDGTLGARFIRCVLESAEKDQWASNKGKGIAFATPGDERLPSVRRQQAHRVPLRARLNQEAAQCAAEQAQREQHVPAVTCLSLNPSSTSHAERSCLSSVSDGCGQYLPYKAGGDRYTTSACMHAVTLSSVTLSPSVLTR